MFIKLTRSLQDPEVCLWLLSTSGSFKNTCHALGVRMTRKKLSCSCSMLFWLVFLCATTVYGLNRISEPNLKAVNFAKSIEGRKLNGSVIKEIEVDSDSVCRLKCVEEERCQSYNFGVTENPAGRFVCQLSDADRFVGLVNFTEDDDFKYRGMQVMFGSSIFFQE